MEQNIISNDEDLTSYLTNAAASIAQFMANYLLSQSQDNPSFRPESVRRDDLLKSIKIYKDFPELDVSVLSITASKLPDYQLYKRLQSQFLNDIKPLEENNE